MSANPSSGGLSEHDFEAIEDAVMETARGRWFLREYARRMRSADTNRLLDALSRIERAMTGQAAAIGPGAKASFDIASIEERRDRLTDLATSLREQGYDGDLCGRIAREAMGLADLVVDMRGSVQADAEQIPIQAPAPRSSDPAADSDDPHACAPLTIEAEVVPSIAAPSVREATHPRPDAAPAQLAPPRPSQDLSALVAIDSLPFQEKLTIFS